MVKRLRLEFRGYLEYHGRMGWWNYGTCAQGDEVPGEDPLVTVARLAIGLGRRKSFHINDLGNETYELCGPRNKRSIGVVRVCEVGKERP